MGVIVNFDYASFIAIYPQFATLSQPQVLQGALPIAELYCRNDGGGPVTKAETQTMLLNLMVAHICQITYGANGQAPAGIVGRVSNASEGSVSVAAEFPMTPNNAWFMQTPFGAAFWQATAAYRTMRYIPGPRRTFNPWPNQ
ncbi:DUF4054 domain-containing protein [Mesorhizobium sp. M7A.F.Ca.MR.148.00.0.0]|uniref:DUF4054 domain-containing protein n=1 Tax=Mesorhizobium sp. M7A.F.Ca.MR.148.00.0.0 TaxID=2496775 RepID=UPI0013E2F153|nr:DUF4054 domain-containing protein [Mesorhizobium sp. M7A.F.Ca.MR.148.00.0.0]